MFRTAGPDRVFTAAVDRVVLAVNSSGSVSNFVALAARLSQTVNDRAFVTFVVVLFAITAAIVSAAGLSGVVGFSVARRTREIAIRVAIRATAAQVRWTVAGEAVTAAFIGAAVGAVSVAWLSGTITHLLYGIGPLDPGSLLIACVAMVVTVAVSAIVPARRALRVSPTDSLPAD